MDKAGQTMLTETGRVRGRGVVWLVFYVRISQTLLSLSLLIRGPPLGLKIEYHLYPFIALMFNEGRSMAQCHGPTSLNLLYLLFYVPSEWVIREALREIHDHIHSNGPLPITNRKQLSLFFWKRKWPSSDPHNNTKNTN